MAAEDRAPPLDDIESTGRRSRVLVIASDPETRDRLATRSRQAGYPAATCTTVADGVSLAGTLGVAALVVEDRDGAGLAALRKASATAALPIVAVAEPRDLGRALETGAADALRRDAIEDELAPRLIAAIRRGRERERTRALETLGRLAATAAHDLNNLFAVILGQAEASLLEARQADLREQLGAIRDATVHAAELTAGLLSRARGAPAREPAPLVVDAIVRQRRGLLQRVAGPTIRLETRLSTDHLHVRGDAARLEQLLLNLVFNARAAMPCGGAVRIETEEVDGWVALRIQDEGNGLPDHARARLLEDLPDWPRGDGLGLFIVRSIVAEHGGRLLVDSAPGEPTTLTFLLPVEAAGRA